MSSVFENLLEFGNLVAKSIYNTLSSASFEQRAVTALAVIGLITVTKFVGFLKSDADQQVLKALRKLPSDAFNGRTVVVFGASSGIGEFIAYEIAKRGGTLILLARRTDRLLDVVNHCHSLGAKGAEFFRFDALDFGSHSEVVDRLFKKHKIDVAVLNFGRSQRGLAERTPLEIDREMMELNFFAVVSLTKLILPHFLKQASGTFVNICSVAANGSPISTAYSATKAATRAFFNALRMETAFRGLHILNVLPGPVESEISLSAFTETVGKAHGDAKEDGTKRMATDRAASLIAAAIWGNLSEIWISPQPILLFTYLNQYFPSIALIFGTRFAGPKRVEAFKQGISGYGAVQSPLDMIKSLFASR